MTFRLTVATIFAVIAILMIGCSPYPSGWTERKDCSNGTCFPYGVPDGGKWLGFRLGMTAREAKTALCEAVTRGDIAAGDAPVQTSNGHCVVRADTHLADGYSAAVGYWLIEMPSLACLPFYFHQNVMLDFGWPKEINDNSRLLSIKRKCPKVYFL